MEAKLSVEDEIFLAQCEEEFKDRYTEKDEEYMKVFNKVPSTPPIMEKFWQASSNVRRNDRRNNRHPYERHGHRDNNRHRDNRRGPKGYNDDNNYSRSRY